MSETKFDLYTATAAEIAAAVDADMRKQKNNAVSKLRKLSDLRWAVIDENRLMLNWIDFDHRGRTPEVIAAHKRYAQAQIDWLVANPGDDLDQATIDLWLKVARDELPLLQELDAAVNWAREVEECYEHAQREGDVEPSDTLQKLIRKRDSIVEDIRNHLYYCIGLTDAEFLDKLNGNFSWRSKTRFRLVDNRGGRRDRGIQLRDITQRGKVLLISMDTAILRCRTLADAKAVCRIFWAPVTSERRDGATYLVGDGFEIVPQ
jgi:hypothetical protein